MSNPAVSERSTRSRDEIFDVLADDKRREILRIVRERSPTGITKTDLAYELAAVTADKSLVAVTDDEHRRALVECQHRSLPALIDANFLEETDGDRVATTDHWLFDDAELTVAINGQTNEFGTDLDALFEALSDSRRRTVLAVLANQYHPISTETLARDVAAREAGTTEREIGQDDLERVLASLVHVHLPVLTDAELVGHDAETDNVSYEGHPALRVSWLETESEAESETETETESDGDQSATGSSAADSTSEAVRTLHGREQIVTTGQSLCERAENELFMMFATTGLLEEGCFRRIEDALDRGVDVYVGSRDPRVREIVRERTPEVVVWEPELDWHNLPPNGASVGRLVFADRNAVLLGTLGTAADDSEYAETAILGEGIDTGLVGLMRQLIGARLDNLDLQSETVSEIPL
ncbi:hypothetical protein GS429_20300 [Natronorubrum sp. JWXQ-INN-674]|uniref:DUF7344 domain-containing protein n=1 Tax=Natronorubrum halalkaliphilum TaxID=2691917 RepID=A0A6B0VSK5_9EURY|nr:hypothetical protein [Natronorubrum halalkaliphilum]MXV64365.1 hypothetical protein [Natronorubrum halalkaliphilum]